jgi:cell division protein FtsA
MSGREIKSCIVGIAGANIESINSRGVVAVTGKGREIAQEDVARVLEAAKAVVIPMDREIIHVIPQTYIVDEQAGIRDPLDMIGVRLEAEVHIVTGSVTTIQNLVKCVSRAGFKVDSLHLQSLAAARSVLSRDEKDIGGLLVDMGAGTTARLVYSGGAPYFTGAVPVGGLNVTNDISIMLSVPMDAAEKIKRQSASCWPASIDADETIVVPGIGGRAPVEITRRKLASIVKPRMEEILRMSREQVENKGHCWSHIKSGVILTGGAAMMPGTVELAQEIFGLPVRMGLPITMGGLVEEYRNPVYSTAVGLVLTGADTMPAAQHPQSRLSGSKADKSRNSGLGKILSWLKKELF